ncbi:hypothetical protein LV89_01545 [Arcicella aurantiaca]|uniref:Signal transduction histidine kinase n=1 Tax=Arcicella aurantiaca TaxID=591202 RepID=A0A316EG20_9BACT|nr:HAMP domain-containing histidine kinase [Arcicella aurantiaca]PWK27654.1 hypothetical protein LV89_01545 [Arcicella aurantiaca]
MKHFFTSLKILLLLFVLNHSFSQSNSINLQKTEKHLSIADGLSNRQINSSFIDSNKKTWFLTDNKIGLFEFGKITNFLLSETFSNRGFNSAYEDANGNFWLSENYEWYYPFNILRCFVFNPKTHRAVPLSEYIHQKIAIHSIIADAQNRIFIGTKNGEIFQFDAKKRSLQLLSSLDKMPVKLLYAGKKGIIACIEQNAQKDKTLLQLDFNGNILTKIDLNRQFVRSVLEVHNQLFCVILKRESILLKEIGGIAQMEFSTSYEAYLNNVFFDKTNNFFVVNQGNSISFFDSTFRFVLKEQFNFLIHDITQDSYGNFILSTNNGVNIVQFNERKFHTFLKNNESEKINENFSCRKIIKIDENQIIVNTNKKRQLINIKTGTIKPLHDLKNDIAQDPHFVLASLKASKGNLLFGEDALVKTNLSTMKDEVLCSFDNIKIWSIAEYKNGYLIGLERKGILYYDNQTKKLIPFSKVNQAFETAIVYDFYINKNEVYIASEAGFFQLLDENRLKKVHFPMGENVQMTCFSIQKNRNQLLLATLNGIWIYDLKSQQMQRFIQEKKYLRKKYLSAYFTRNGVWASTEEGIWHFDNQGNLMKIYTVADGLTSNECNRLAHFQDEKGVLYFGGINGLNIFNPTDFSNKIERKFSLQLDSISTYRDTTQSRVIPEFKDSFLRLNRGENTLKMTFSFEDFKFNCEKKYYYRTDRSLTKEWQMLTDRRLLINNISYGNTTIEIMVVSCDDFLNADTKKITINRPNPLYMTWYFWVIIFILLSVLTYGMIKYSTYQLKRRNKILQQKVDEQTLSLQESLNLKETLLSLLVHDVRYPVQSFYDITKKMAYLIKKNDVERLLLLGNETENKSRKVLWLIDELVYWVKSTNKSFSIQTQDCHLGQLIQQIFEIYADELQEKKLTYKIENANTRANIEQGLFVIIMRNLIFNSVIHSKPETEVGIIIEQNENNCYKIIIINEINHNNDVSNKGLGIGMTLLLPILKNANFKIESEKNRYVFTSKLLINTPK